MTPKVSVVVPVCNSEQYLAECLDSILGQTLSDIEIVCVDDGSSDSSPTILKDYAKQDSRIVVITQENSGYGKAMNVGINAAKGDWIGFVESDDYIVPEMYEKLFHLADENELDFIKSNLCRFYGEGADRIIQVTPITRREELLGKILDPSEDPSLLDVVMNNVTGIYSRRFIEDANIKFNESPGASFQDNGFWFQTFMHGKRAMFVKENLYMVRRDNPNSSVKSKGKVFCMRDEYKFIFSLLEKDSELFDRFIFQWCKKLFSNYVMTLNRVDASFRLDLLLTMSEDYRMFQDQGWLNLSLFNPSEKRKILMIMEDPRGYADRFVDIRIGELSQSVRNKKRAITKAKRELESLKNSYSLKLGSLISGSQTRDR